MSVLPGRHELLQSRLDRFTRMLHGVEAGELTAIHRTRVASRRLREVLPVLQLEANTAAKLARALRRVTRRLGSIRELDVLILLTDELHESGRYPTRAVGRLEVELRKAREKAQDELGGKAIAAELRRLARKLEAAATLKDADVERSGARGWRWAIEARVARRAGNVKAAISAAGAVYLPERLHAVRIDLKKLRYGVELAVESAGAKRHANLRILKRAQDVLGRLHDLQVLIDHVRRVQALDASDSTARHDFDALTLALERNCRRLHGRYVRERAALMTLCDRLVARSARAPRRDLARRAG